MTTIIGHLLDHLVSLPARVNSNEEGVASQDVLSFILAAAKLSNIHSMQLVASSQRHTLALTVTAAKIAIIVTKFPLPASKVNNAMRG